MIFVHVALLNLDSYEIPYPLAFLVMYGHSTASQLEDGNDYPCDEPTRWQPKNAVANTPLFSSENLYRSASQLRSLILVTSQWSRTLQCSRLSGTMFWSTEARSRGAMPRCGRSSYWLLKLHPIALCFSFSKADLSFANCLQAQRLLLLER